MLSPDLPPSILPEIPANQRRPPPCPWEKSLAALFPDVARQLHPTLNGDITAAMISAKSGKIYIWQCDVDQEHIWAASPCNRTLRHSGCPFCDGKKVDRKKSLLALRPDIAVHWHYELNGELRPEQVTCYSHKRVWWRCRRNSEHSFKLPVANRITMSGDCDRCRGKYVTDENRLTLCFPEVAAEFHPTKNRMLYPESAANSRWFRNYFAPGEEPKRNRKLTAADLPVNAEQLIWWQGKCGPAHDWRATVYDRTHGHGCPFCAGKQVAPDRSLLATFPAAAKQFHPSRNGAITAAQILPHSLKKYWFRCFKFADHVFKATVCSVVRSWKSGTNACPHCHGKKVLYRDSLAAKFPSVAKMLRPRTNTIDATAIFPNSNEFGDFQCPRVLYHQWKARISWVVRSCKTKNTGCPYCAGRKVHKIDSVLIKFPSVARYFDKRPHLFVDPAKLSPGSGQIVPFRCFEAGHHTWRQQVGKAVANYKAGRILCPQCRAGAR
jgi:hypothetical protein